MTDYLAELTGGKVHTGNWGTPELGVTEWVGNLLGATRTDQGGSDISGSTARTISAPVNYALQTGIAGTQGTFGNGGIIPQKTLSGAGGGSTTSTPPPTGSGMSLSEQMEKGLIPWDDNKLNAGGGSGYDPTEQARRELQEQLDILDYEVGNMKTAEKGLETERTRSLGELETQKGLALSETGKAKEEATSATIAAQNKALSTAQDVTKKNRNVLRALGILSSSAGGEILTKAMTEYGTQAGQLQQGLLKRLATVEDWWMNRSKEFETARQNVESQYAQLKEKIQNDLRFTERQRLTAVQAAQTAARQYAKDYETQQQAYKLAAQQYSDNILLKLAEIKMYNNPSADVSALYNQLLSSAQGAQPRQVATALSEEQRRKQQEQSGLLGSPVGKTS